LVIGRRPIPFDADFSSRPDPCHAPIRSADSFPDAVVVRPGSSLQVHRFERLALALAPAAPTIARITMVTAIQRRRSCWVSSAAAALNSAGEAAPATCARPPSAGASDWDGAEALVDAEALDDAEAATPSEVDGSGWPG